jgi:hypothetical protein
VRWGSRRTLGAALLSLLLVPAAARAQNLTFTSPAFLNADAVVDAADDMVGQLRTDL